MRITKIGIPPGGDTNQVLVKSSGTDYDVEWGTGSGTATPPGGLNTQVQFNDGGVFGGDSGFTYNKTTNRLTLGSLVLNDVVDPGVDTDKFLVLTSLGVVSYRNGASVLVDIGGVPTSRTLTINGTSYDLSANRTWSVGTVTSVAALTLGTTGTDLSSSVANGNTAPVITLNVPTASAANRGALSSADWTTFNNKENALTFSSPLSRSTNTISIPAATGSVNGYLTSTDWTTFNGKQNALNGTGFVKISGTTISYDNSTYYLASNPNGYTSNVGTVTSIATSAPITGGTITGSGTIGITQASGSSDGYLSSTDWTTFNNKQNALTNPVTGTGSSGQVAYFNGTTSITSESNLFWDASNDRLGIGTASPEGNLHVAGSIRVGETGSTAKQTIIYHETTGNGYTSIQSVYQNVAYTPIVLNPSGSNVLIGTTTNGTYKLDVNGTGRFSGLLTANSFNATDADPYLVINQTTNTNNSGIKFQTNTTEIGKITAQGSSGQMNINMGVSSGWGGYITFSTDNSEKMRLNASGNLGLGVTPSAWSQSKAIQINTIGALRADTSTIGLNNNAYFDSGWKYLTNGTASSYEQNSGQHIWNTAPNNTSGAGAALTFTQAMTLTANGDLIIGSGADTGESLQVQGDLKVSMNTTNPVATFTNLNTAGTGNGVLIQLNSVLGSDNYILKLVSNAADRFILKENGQLRLNDYTTTTSFTGTAVGYLAFENDGDIITRSPAQVLSDIGGLPTTGATISPVSAFEIDNTSTAINLRVQSSAAINLYAESTINSDTNFVATVNKIIDQPGAPASVGATSSINFTVTNNSGTQVSPGYISTELTSFSPSNGDLKLYSLSSGSNISTLNCSSGIVKLPQGQLEFPSTQNASANSNTLDDYEEGNWTPAFGNTGASITYATNGQVGSYTKIGRQVTCYFRLQLATSTMSGNSLTITSLPFTSANVTNQEFNCTISWQSTITTFVNVQGRIAPSSTTLNLYKTTSAATLSTTGMVGTDIGTNSIIFGTLTYFV